MKSTVTGATVPAVSLTLPAPFETALQEAWMSKDRGQDVDDDRG